jgi:hypothetical protein
VVFVIFVIKTHNDLGVLGVLVVQTVKTLAVKENGRQSFISGGEMKSGKASNGL